MTVADAVPDGGALGAVYTALLASPIDHVLVLACDLPFVSEPFLRHLIARAPRYEAGVPRTACGWHPLCAVYHRRGAQRLKAQIDARHLRLVDALLQLQLLEMGPSEVAEFDPEGTLLTNVNTPDDYHAARRHAEAQRAVSRSVPHPS